MMRFSADSGIAVDMKQRKLSGTARFRFLTRAEFKPLSSRVNIFDLWYLYVEINPSKTGKTKSQCRRRRRQRPLFQILTE